MVELPLKNLVCEVDAELLKAVGRHDLKPFRQAGTVQGTIRGVSARRGGRKRRGGVGGGVGGIRKKGTVQGTIRGASTRRGGRGACK